MGILVVASKDEEVPDNSLSLIWAPGDDVTGGGSDAVMTIGDRDIAAAEEVASDSKRGAKAHDSVVGARGI